MGGGGGGGGDDNHWRPEILVIISNQSDRFQWMKQIENPAVYIRASVSWGQVLSCFAVRNVI